MITIKMMAKSFSYRFTHQGGGRPGSGGVVSGGGGDGRGPMGRRESA